MRTIIALLPIIIFFGFTLINTSNIEVKDGESFNVQINDSTEITIVQAINKETNLPIYYYSNLFVPACNTGECKLIVMKMYWDIYGNYYKYTVPKNSPLTKAQHKPFSKKEYYKLHLILNDTTSSLKTLKFEDLTEKEAKKRFITDGKTGASIKFVGEIRIKGAIKTSYTLWHIANGFAQNKIKDATIKYFNIHNELSNLFEHNPKTNTDIIKLLVDFDRFNLTQTQGLIKNIEDNNIELKPIKSSIKKCFNDKNIDKTILLANYYLHFNYKSCKAKNVAKQINYFEN